MGMKPRLNDGPQNLPGTVTQAKRVDEFGNIPHVVTTLKVQPNTSVPGTVNKTKSTGK